MTLVIKSSGNKNALTCSNLQERKSEYDTNIAPLSLVYFALSQLVLNDLDRSLYLTPDFLNFSQFKRKDTLRSDAHLVVSISGFGGERETNPSPILLRLL